MQESFTVRSMAADALLSVQYWSLLRVFHVLNHQSRCVAPCRLREPAIVCTDLRKSFVIASAGLLCSCERKGIWLSCLSVSQSGLHHCCFVIGYGIRIGS